MTRGLEVYGGNGVTRGVGMTRGLGLAGGVVVSSGVVISGEMAVTIGGGADRGNHLSQLAETVVRTTPTNPRTATMI